MKSECCPSTKFLFHSSAIDKLYCHLQRAMNTRQNTMSVIIISKTKNCIKKSLYIIRKYYIKNKNKILIWNQVE